MLYLAIPAQNEVATIGVLLWRLRTVLAEFPREYEVVVYDDASADETADVAEQYAHAMPVTVLRGTKPVGYAGAVDALVRHISGHTRYPRRDAMLLLQGDFTDPPGIVPEFARRFEGGADLVVGERTAVVDAPTPVKRLFTAAGWALRPFVRVDGIRDLTGSMRLVRISVLRDALRTAGDAPVCEGDSWTANADLLLRLVPHARRVESVPMEPTYGVRMRETRRVTVRDALATLRWGWRARGRRAVPTTVPEAVAESTARPARGSAPTARRRDEPEMTAERLRERKRDRDRPRSDSGLEDTVEMARREKSRRDRRDARNATEAPATTSVREVAESAESREVRNDRKRDKEAKDRGREKERTREESARGDAGTDQNAERGTERRERTSKRGRGRDAARDGVRDGARDAVRDDDLMRTLDDPFAAPMSRRDPKAETRSDSHTDSSAETSSASPTDARSDSPYADEPAPDRVRGEVTRHVTPTRAVVPPAVGANSADDDEQDDAPHDVGDTEAADGAAEGADPSEAATRERKRRRNRRSRKRKSRAQSVDSSTEDATAGADGAEADSAHTDAPVARRPRDGAARDGDARDRAADDDSDSSESEGANDDGEGASDSASGGGDADAAQARAKRRGRRGRRGGARRSRNRGKTDGSAAGAATEDGSSSEGGGSSDDGAVKGIPRPHHDASDE